MAPPVDVGDPVESDELAAVIGRAALRLPGPVVWPVLDDDEMARFVGLMGPEWVARNLRKFAIEVERGLASLDAASPSELAGIAHAMIMMAAHCGFIELLNAANLVQREARRGFGSDHVAELRAAGERALAVMRS
jgi:hypothetical protein